METKTFWSQAQPGFRFTDAEPGTLRFYEEVEAHRYALDPHIPEVVRFDEWADRDVLEVACGVGTDAARSARAGARYTGTDQTGIALKLARRRFQLEELDGHFEPVDATHLTFANESFDLVFSHGVIHHMPETAAAVAEFRRVLRAGGTVLVTVHHRGSWNYRCNILAVRRTLAAMLAVPGVAGPLKRVLPADGDLLAGRQQLLREHGLRYLSDTKLFLTNNTDGPGNPLSKVYSRREIGELFSAFTDVATETRYLNLRLYRGGGRIAATKVARKLERRIGWHLYVRAVKPH